MSQAKSTTEHATIEASHPRASSCMPDDSGAVDVDVSVVLADGRELDGEVTLLPSEQDGRLGAWGDPDHWVSNDMLRTLRTLDHDVYRSILGEVEACAREAVKRA